MVSEEIEYIEPTQEHVGQMVQVRDTDDQPWIHCELLAVLPTKVPYRFCCYHEPNGSKVRAWEFARIPRPKPQPTQEPTTNPIDWTKPVRTKDGRAVRVLCTDGPNAAYPVIGFIVGNDACYRWTISGKWWDGKDSNLDIENAPQRIQREFWVCVYPEDTGLLWQSREEALRMSKDADPIAIVKITIDCEEGEGL